LHFSHVERFVDYVMFSRLDIFIQRHLEHKFRYTYTL